MLKKIAVPSVLLAVLLATAIPSEAQTRPRRVTQASSTSNEETARRRETAPRRRGSFMRILVGVGESIGSCTPSRDRVGTRPRLGL